MGLPWNKTVLGIHIFHIITDIPILLVLLFHYYFLHLDPQLKERGLIYILNYFRGPEYCYVQYLAIIPWSGSCFEPRYIYPAHMWLYRSQYCCGLCWTVTGLITSYCWMCGTDLDNHYQDYCLNVVFPSRLVDYGMTHWCLFLELPVRLSDVYREFFLVRETCMDLAAY